MVNPKVAANDVAELVKLAKAQPGKLDFANSGRGAAAYWRRSQQEGRRRHRRNRLQRSAPALQDVSPAKSTSCSPPRPPSSATSGRERSRPRGDHAPAIARGPRPSDDGRVGFPGFDTTTWHGRRGRGDPDDVSKKLTDAALQALTDPETKKKLTDLGVDVQPMGPDEFAAYIKSSTENGRTS